MPETRTDRWIPWAAFAALLGAGLGFFAAALADAWVRLHAGAYTRSTLFHVFGLLVLALASWWAAAGARTRALAPPLPANRFEQVFVTPPPA